MSALPVEATSTAIPTFATRRRPERPSDGAALGLIAAAIGTPFGPAQQLIADVAMEYNPENHRYYYGTVVISAPRRGLKTAFINAYKVFRTMRWKGQRLSYSAQLGKDSLELLRDLHERLEDNPTFKGRYVPRFAAGTEHLRCPPTGGLVRYLAPNRRTGHGRDNDVVIFDEAWGIDPEVGRQIEVGLFPTLATRPNPQIFIMSAAGDLKSTWWDEWRQKGRQAVENDVERGVAFFEWAGDPEDVYDDPKVWWRVHPALAEGRITEDFLKDQLSVMTPEDFTRAYLNRPVANIKRVITEETMKKTRSTENIPEDAEVVFGFDVDLDRTSGVIVASARGKGGKALWEVVDARPGTFWMADRLAELQARHKPRMIAMEASGPAASIADELKAKHEIEARRLKGPEYSSACSSVYDALVQREPMLYHRGETVMLASAATAVKRNVGDSWVWARRMSAGSISALVAGTCAFWAIDAPVKDKKPTPGIF